MVKFRTSGGIRSLQEGLVVYLSHLRYQFSHSFEFRYDPFVVWVLCPALNLQTCKLTHTHTPTHTRTHTHHIHNHTHASTNNLSPRRMRSVWLFMPIKLVFARLNYASHQGLASLVLIKENAIECCSSLHEFFVQVSKNLGFAASLFDDKPVRLFEDTPARRENWHCWKRMHLSLTVFVFGFACDMYCFHPAYLHITRGSVRVDSESEYSEIPPYK